MSVLARVILLRILWTGVRTHKGLYQITETTKLQDFQQRQQLNWIAHGTRKENNDNQIADIPHYIKKKVWKETPE